MDAQKQKHLVEKAIKGDKGALETLLVDKQRDILYMAIHFSSAQEAEDLAHDAMIHIIQGIPNLKDPEKFNSWLYSVVKNTCKNERRRKANNASIHLSLDDDGVICGPLVETRSEFIPADYVEHEEKREIVMDVMRSLPEGMKESLVLFYYSQMSYKEIADMLDVNEKKVANDLLRGRALFKKRLEERVGHTLAVTILPAGTIPTLTKVLEADAMTCVTGSMQAGLAGTLTAQTAGLKAAAATALSGKTIAAGIAAATVLLTAGVTMYHIKAPTPTPDKTAAAVTREIPQQIAQETQRAEQALEEQLLAINSLSDMIGAENEAKLITYEKEGVNEKEWLVFIRDIDAVLGEQADTQAGYDYQRYELTKLNKRLTLAAKRNKESKRVTVRYIFEDSDTEPLRMPELILMLE